MKVGITYHTIQTHIAFAFSGFFCKNVTFESFLEGNFTGTGNFKALLCAAVGFNLWHYITIFKLLPAGVPTTAGLFWGLTGNE